MTHYPDHKLRQMLKANQRLLVNKALRQIMHQYQDDFIKFLQRKSTSLEDAEEIFNESLLVLVHNARKGLLDKSDASIKPYLIQICKNKAWTKWKKKMDFVDFDSSEVQNTFSDLDTLEHLFKEEKRKYIEELLDKLGKTCKELLIRIYWDGQKMSDIAQYLGFASGASLRNKKLKCMNKLRDLLGLGPSPFD